MIISNPEQNLIWFFRTDKIGDTVLSLPLDELVRNELQNHRVRWFLHSSTLFLAEKSEPKRQAKTLPKFWELVKLAREEKPKAAVVLQAQWWVSLALLLGGVPLRAGRLSQWHSFLFFNRGVRQQRSLSEKSELAYGAEIITHAFPQAEERNSKQDPGLSLRLQAPQRSLVTQVLEKWNLQPNNYYVVHPGMAGSARNWPESHYSELLERLTKESTVVITGTIADHKYLQILEPSWKVHPRIRWTVAALGMEELLAVLSRATGVVAPSTGVLHLAASLGTSVYGIYSPIRVHHPKRWAPNNSNKTATTKIFLPQVDCPAIHSCLGDKCPHWDCMTTISAEEIFLKLREAPLVKN